MRAGLLLSSSILLGISASMNAQNVMREFAWVYHNSQIAATCCEKGKDSLAPYYSSRAFQDCGEAPPLPLAGFDFGLDAMVKADRDRKIMEKAHRLDEVMDAVTSGQAGIKTGTTVETVGKDRRTATDMSNVGLKTKGSSVSRQYAMKALSEEIARRDKYRTLKALEYTRGLNIAEGVSTSAHLAQIARNIDPVNIQRARSQGLKASELGIDGNVIKGESPYGGLRDNFLRKSQVVPESNRNIEQLIAAVEAGETFKDFSDKELNRVRNLIMEANRILAESGE